jgi:hypothetical protein
MRKTWALHVFQISATSVHAPCIMGYSWFSNRFAYRRYALCKHWNSRIYTSKSPIGWPIGHNLHLMDSNLCHLPPFYCLSCAPQLTVVEPSLVRYPNDLPFICIFSSLVMKTGLLKFFHTPLVDPLVGTAPRPKREYFCV